MLFRSPHRGARQRRSQRSPRRASQGGGKGAAARDCTGAPSHRTVVRASVGASAARDEQPGRWQRRRRLRLHECSLAPHCGERQRGSQRSPRRARRATAEAPPPEAARVQPRTTLLGGARQRRSQRRDFQSAERPEYVLEGCSVTSTGGVHTKVAKELRQRASRAGLFRRLSPAQHTTKLGR